jgi:hypothetical protein
VFVARNGVSPPDKLIFRNEADVTKFQRSVDIGSVSFGNVTIELQRVAAEALESSIEDAAAVGLSITPRGADSGRRSYADTVELWRSRVEPALSHWGTIGRLSTAEAEEIRSRSPFEQVPMVFELEKRGLWFSKDLSKSIIYSVAPPGTSQHLSMLAFDAREFNEPRVREILAGQFWYQTVVSDLPHFTFLGVEETSLADIGLKNVSYLDRSFWLPDL